jgi:deazaflavin-dependent oxidoreductase (nitroreductase family)
MSGTTKSHPCIDASTVDPVDPVDPVGPSLLVRLVLTPMTKMLNPIIGKLAGRRHVPMAQLEHIGRRTGKAYATSVGARLASGVVLIPLTFGNQSDWARNVYAAGGCSVQINGAAYHLVHPQFLDVADAEPATRVSFHAVERLVFKVLGIKQFMRLELPVQ